jgi:hypothetical protein
VSDDEARLHFLEKALDETGQWIRFADPKALAALAILGLGFSNLLSFARPLVDAHVAGSFWGWLATGAFFLAASCAIVAVLTVVRSLFPHVKPAAPAQRTLYFFGDVARFGSATEYEQEVGGRTAQELESEIAGQVWAVSQIAAEKHRYTKWALLSVVAFLCCWAAARLGLSLQDG